MPSIGERLLEERERLGLNQPVLAEMCGVTMRSQRNYEKGERQPDAAYLAAIAAAGADIQYIVTGKRAAKAGPQPPLDTALLRDCIQVLTEGFANLRRKPSPAQMAEAILLAYEIARGDGKVMKEKFEPILRLVA